MVFLRGERLNMYEVEGIPCSDIGGVKPITIGGRMVREHERFVCMTTRSQKHEPGELKDQILTEQELVFVKNLILFLEFQCIIFFV